METGIALLSEQGWSGLTARALAERAGANPGLIHYHFGGLPGLHAEIYRRAVELLVSPLIEELLGAGDERAALATIRGLLPYTTGDEPSSRLAVELISGAVRDPALGVVLRDELRQARMQVADRLSLLHPGWSPAQAIGTATLIVAAIDGLILHHLVDGELAVDEAMAVVERLLPEEEA
ncbi:TetR/AcrR family transcriptional regulator [Nonomuraea longicatena]|uniref:TetR family transcriptional regulator n=1 Tax=Nonomuraea longicatena TaxID=83682 RepID=A0ABP4BF44_9ACTN